MSLLVKIRLLNFSGLAALACLLCSVVASAQDSELFPRPAGLEPAIQFWIRVYTEVDTQSGFLHDARHLSVVYTSMDLNRRAIDRRRKQIQEDLRVLGGGKRDGLSASQQQILALWPADVSDSTLTTAASNVRWQLGQSDRFLGGLQRSGAYRDYIRNVINQRDLPRQLAVLPHVESSFNPGAYSSASAAGMWQFGRATGRRFMRIDHIVDERMDPYIASHAAMSLLEYNYGALGTWPLALTAYNHGAGGMARAVRETGTTDIETIVADYRGRAFGFASRNFYAQFLAVNEIEDNLDQYFNDIRYDSYPEFVEVTTDSFIDAEVFARSVGVSLEQLQADNPALRPAIWQGNKRIPENFTLKLRPSVASSQGQVLALIPDQFKHGIQKPDVAYVVERGDSLSVIARRFSTSISELVSLNQLASRNRIRIGQRLLLPQDNASSIAPSNGIYTVRRGDSVSTIASRYGVSAQALLAANGIRNANRIYPGQELKLPGVGSSEVQLATAEPLPPVVSEPSPVAIAPAAEEVTTAEVEPLPPAAVLPDNQTLDEPVSVADQQAVALEPEADDSQGNRETAEILAADPSDYNVASNNSIEIHASETLGHYADWLDIRASDLRRLNNMRFRDPVIIGKRIGLDFSKVSQADFVQKRLAFHSALQQAFFSNYRIQDIERYQLKRNENVSVLASRRFSTPLWLLRQYNPELDLDRVRVGQEVVFPLLERVE